MNLVRRHWFVEGRVQGVWFRESTRREAERLGEIAGWVRNLPDGRVEVLAEGPSDRLESLHFFLAKGPDLARVKRVTESSGSAEGPLVGFRIIP